MNKLFTKIAGVFLGLAMAVGVGVAASSSSEAVPVSAATAPDVYVFTANDYSGTLNEKEYVASETFSNVTLSGGSFLNEGIQHLAGKSSTVTTVKSYPNVSKIVMSYCTNKSKGSGKLTVKVGSGTEKSFSVKAPNSDGTALKEQEFSFATPESGVITVGCSATVNSVYFHGFTVYYEEGEQKTVASLTTTPKNSETVNLDANGASTVSANKLIYKVEYTDGTSDYAATINISPSDGATYVDDGNGNLALSFTKNGKYAVTVTADATHKSTINYVVTGIPTQEYELYTGAIVKGDYVIMSGDPDFTYALGNSVDAKSNRINNADNAPKVSSNKIVNPDSSLVWRIEKNGNYWTVKNISLNKYLASTANEKEAQLLSDASGNEALWSISYDKDWVFNNVARNTKSYLRNNNNYGWACYAIDTGNAPTLFKLPSTEPAIAVEMNGNLNLGVGETTQLTATKINGATGTVAWSADNNHVELSATIGDSITVTGRTDGTTNVTATLTDGSTVEPVVTAFTVTKKLSSIQVATAPNKTVYTEGEAFDKTGMVILATYDDGSTENPTDFTYTPDGALTPSDKEVTISWGGKTATQSITVNVKVVASISVNQAPTKARYHAGDDFDSTGLKIEVSYENEETAVITSGFVISPESYKFTSEDEVTGTKEFTVTYGGK